MYRPANLTARQRRQQRIRAANTGAIIRYRNDQGSAPYQINRNPYSGEFVFNIEVNPNYTQFPRMVTLGNLNAMEDAIETLFNNIMDFVIFQENLVPADMVQLIIVSNVHIWTHLQRISQLTPNEMVNRIANALGSQHELLLEFSEVHIRYVRRVQATGDFYKSPDDFVRKKQSIVKIYSKDQCFWHCIALGIAEYTDPPKFIILTKAQRTTRLRDAQATIHRTTCGLPKAITQDDFPAVEATLMVSLLVINYYGKQIMYSSTTYDRLICLLLIPGDETHHFHYVRKDHIGRLWSRQFFCKLCMRAYINQKHACFKKCRACKSPDCNGATSTSWKFFFNVCSECNCKFFDDDCFRTHKRNKLCDTYIKCLACNYISPRDEQHICHHRLCSNCKELVDMRVPHLCHHQPLTEKDLPKVTDKYIFYDYETYLDQRKVHVVVGIVAMYLTEDTFLRFFTTEEFLDWLLVKKHKDYTCVAHNSGRYDFHFIKRVLLQRGIESSDICNGNTIFYSKLKDLNIRFVDSYRLIPLPLRSFPATFGLKELKKGYFPYRFLTEETRTYYGPLPDIKWFDFDKLKPKDHKAALQWYNENKGKDIHLMDLCWEYCESDVLLLKEGCEAFRYLFLSVSNQEVDPLQFITIASVCMALYRRFYLPKNSIAIMDSEGYTSDYKYQLWKAFQIHKGTFSEDIQFRICLDWGCPKCYHPFSKHPISHILMRDIFYHRTEGLTHEHVLWEHDVDFETEEMLDFKETLFEFKSNQLKPRDAFYGGRTEPIHLHYKCSENERIRYLDYTSLYPSVQFGQLRGVTAKTYNTQTILEYPIGHGVYVDNVTPDDLHLYFGFVRCDVDPPEDLFIPILPERKHGKLMFDLYPKRNCTWVIKEVLLAMEYGYKIVKIHSVMHFPRKSSELFKGYVSSFIKIKTEAAGWKDLGCFNDIQKELFLNDFKKNMGIDLDPAKISEERNSGMYSISKLCLNNLWGKFGQHDSFSMCVDIFDWSTMETYMVRDDIELLGVVLHGNYARTLTYKTRTDFISVPAYTNVPIAAFTTTHARCRLYEALASVPSTKILYMDTDSIIFVEPNDKTYLKTGKYLGDLTDEIGEDDAIVEFVSTGPKSYAYHTKKGKHEVKVKGITLNVSTLKQLDFNVMHAMTNDATKCLVTQPLQFVINSDHTIQTKVFKEGQGKRFRMTMNKRDLNFIDRTDTCFSTLPKKPKSRSLQ